MANTTKKTAATATVTAASTEAPHIPTAKELGNPILRPYDPERDADQIPSQYRQGMVLEDIDDKVYPTEWSKKFGKHEVKILPYMGKKGGQINSKGRVWFHFIAEKGNKTAPVVQGHPGWYLMEKEATEKTTQDLPQNTDEDLIREIEMFVTNGLWSREKADAIIAAMTADKDESKEEKEN